MEKPYLATFDDDGWTVSDGEVAHQNSPETFEIPPYEERNTLEIGDWAKLRFLFFAIEINGTPINGERMWVEVVVQQGDFYKGVLINSPVFLEALQYGDVVWFEPRHVIDIVREWEQEDDEDDYEN